MCCKKTSSVIFKKKSLYSTYSSFLVISTSNQRKTDAFECGNEPSGSVKCGEFLDQLQTSSLLKKDSAQWSKKSGKDFMPTLYIHNIHLLYRYNTLTTNQLVVTTGFFSFWRLHVNNIKLSGFALLRWQHQKELLTNANLVSSGVRRGANYGVNQFGFYLSEESRIKNQTLFLYSRCNNTTDILTHFL